MTLRSAPPIPSVLRSDLCRSGVVGFVVACSAFLTGRGHGASAADEKPVDLPALAEIRVASSLDGSQQPSILWVPAVAESRPVPLLVYLHSWSGNYRQKNDGWLAEAVARGWIFLHPDFRGANDEPAACGSERARRDVLDAIDHVVAKHRVDTTRIYVAGSSGGGHMTMQMAAWHPERFSAASAWVGISDLAEWHRFHVRNGKVGNYAAMVEKCCGGAPGASPQVDAEYRARSPLFHLQRAKDLPLDLNAGVDDGHTGSVPVAHTLRAFNVLAGVHGTAPVSDDELRQLWEQRKLERPLPSDVQDDPTYGRAILLRRTAGACRATIFAGGHEGLPKPACAWLATQVRETRPAPKP